MTGSTFGPDQIQKAGQSPPNFRATQCCCTTVSTIDLTDKPRLPEHTKMVRQRCLADRQPKRNTCSLRSLRRLRKFHDDTTAQGISYGQQHSAEVYLTFLRMTFIVHLAPKVRIASYLSMR